MKKLYPTLAFLIMSIFIVSCGLIEFDFDTSTKGKVEKPSICPPSIGDFEIPAEFKEALTSQLNDVISNSFDDIIKEVKKQDTWPADSIVLKKLNMVQTNIPNSVSSSNTLGFISEMNIYISLKDGSKEISFADIKNTDTKATVLKFNIINKNIISYIDKGFKLRIDSKLRDCPSQDIDFDNKITVHVKL